jgi:hypothetical protein
MALSTEGVFLRYEEGRTGAAVTPTFSGEALDACPLELSAAMSASAVLLSVLEAARTIKVTKTLRLCV